MSAAGQTVLVDPDVRWTPAARTPGSPERDALLLAHAPLVKFLAHRIARRLSGTVDLNDLVGDGMLGLIEAVDSFDPRRKVRFKTYAETRIRGAILDGVRSRDWAPRSVRRAARMLDTAIAAVEGRTGEAADDEAIAEELGISVEELQRVYLRARASSISTSWTDDEGGEPVDHGESPLDCLEADERRRLVSEEIAGLPEREKLVLSLYYERGLSLREIGEILGVTESRVCQIHTRAVARLRARIAARVSVPETIA
ncbi:MAG: RNA polymerase sigma factor WhiG [Acidobacteriota bacterium]